MGETCSPFIDSCIPEFPVSEPVFTIAHDDYWNCVRISHSESHKVVIPQTSDNAIVNIAISEFSERFDHSTKKFTYDRSVLVGKVSSKCASVVQRYFQEHSPLKKPKNSSTYRFLCNISSKGINSDLNDDIARLARYILEYQVDNRHKSNILALINALKDKYEAV